MRNLYPHFTNLILACNVYSVVRLLKFKYKNRPGNRLISQPRFMFVDPCIIVQFIKKNPTRCNNVSKFYCFIFIWSSTRFGRHTAHHQEPKTALAAPGFSHVEVCWTCSWWTLSGTYSYSAWKRPPTVRQTTFHLWKTRGCQAHYVPDNVHQLHVQQPSMYEKPEAASEGLGS